MTRIYLDYNATTPIRPEAIAAVNDAMHHTGNASSVHFNGRGARKFVEDARTHVATLCGVRPAQVIFNAGATEGNNTILHAYADKSVLVSATEHPSSLAPVPHAHHIPVTRDGVIDLDAFEGMLKEHNPALVSVQWVNSETGVIQPIDKISSLAKAYGAWMHCDAVQAAGRMNIDFKSSGLDTLVLSAHKFGGPQGVGALIFRETLTFPKFMQGGGQEKRQRAGTENVAGIAGFGVAAKLAVEQLDEYRAHCATLQTRFEDGLKRIANDIVIVGDGTPRVPNTSNVLLPGTSAETQLMAMDLEGVSVSSGSACSSGAFKPSHVMAAMGYSEEDARSALRFSWGWDSKASDIDAALAAYDTMVKRLRK
jgi:cysteine desulfurase